MNFERQDIGLGLFVVGAIAAIIVGLVAVAGILEGETIKVHVSVDAVSNLRRGAPVYVSGYRVGDVSRIDPVYEPVLHFDLTMEIDADFPLYDGTTAAINSQGFIGDAVVELQVPVQRGQRLTDGAVMMQAFLPDLSHLVSRADTLAQTIQEVVHNLAEFLSPDVAGALVEDLRSTMVATRETFAVLEGELVALADSLRYGMRVATGSLEQVSGVIEENRERISGTLDSTMAMVRDMRGFTTTLGGYVDTARPGLERTLVNLEAVLVEMRTLLADMNRYSLWQILFKVRHPDNPDRNP